MTNEEAENIVNDVFPGITFYYRDTPLSLEDVALYKKGMILLEPAFTDCSSMGGGIVGNTRYLIASSKAADLGKLQPEVKQYGMMVLNAGAFFKVLDVHREEDYIQILLLHIPNNAVDFFSATNTNLEDFVVQKAREKFDQRKAQPPIDALNSDDWKSRIDFPLGISKHGTYYFSNNN